MLQAWKARHTCRTPDDPIPWMLAIARREAWRTRPDGAEVPLDEWSAADRATFDAVDGVVERLAVQAAIARLDEEERQLLHLRYVDDLTQPSVAQRLGIPEGTAKVRLYRARNRLRSLLSPA